MINALDHRKADHPIEPLILRRWSPRAMSGEPISDGEMLTLFEAARWAPSTFNEQEWRFLYGRRDTPQWPVFLNLLVEGNRAWCQRAAMLVVICAHKVFTRNGKPNPMHVFECGNAFENRALQGTAMGLRLVCSPVAATVVAVGWWLAHRARPGLPFPVVPALLVVSAARMPGPPP